MTKLTVKDLNCENCDASKKNVNEDYFCGMTNTEIDFTDFDSTKLRGCCLHPLALQVLAGPVIEELKKHNDDTESRLFTGNFSEGIIKGRKEAIKLLKEGVKKP